MQRKVKSWVSLTTEIKRLCGKFSISVENFEEWGKKDKTHYMATITETTLRLKFNEERNNNTSQDEFNKRDTT